MSTRQKAFDPAGAQQPCHCSQGCKGVGLLGVMLELCLPRMARKSHVTGSMLFHFKRKPESLLVFINYLACGNWKCAGECQDCLSEQKF